MLCHLHPDARHDPHYMEEGVRHLGELCHALRDGDLVVV